jgi:hypothetical protein
MEQVERLMVAEVTNLNEIRFLRECVDTLALQQDGEEASEQAQQLLAEKEQHVVVESRKLYRWGCEASMAQAIRTLRRDPSLDPENAEDMCLTELVNTRPLTWESWVISHSPGECVGVHDHDDVETCVYA